MTCIAAVAHGGKVWIGGDSAGVAGYDIMVRADSKVFKWGDDMLVGGCGSFRIRDLVRYQLSPPPFNDTRDLTEWMVCEVAEAIRNIGKTGGAVNTENNDEGMSSSTSLLVGVRGRLFLIDSDFQIGESRDPYAAIGCGGAVALGSLYSTHKTKLAPKERVLTALKASARFSGGVCGPFAVKEL